MNSMLRQIQINQIVFGLLFILNQFYSRMRIVIVSATEMEIASLRHLPMQTSHHIEFLIHGVGMMMSMFHLQKLMVSKPDLIIQCGVAGAYSNHLSIGQTVIVRSEMLGDTGAEDHEEFLDLIDLNLMDHTHAPFTNGELINPDTDHCTSLQKVRSITVNAGAGNEKTIKLRRQKYNPDIESMEGACLHYACLMNHIPFMQFRAISNMVEPRNKDHWDMPKAIENCHQEVVKYIQQIP